MKPIPRQLLAALIGLFLLPAPLCATEALRYPRPLDGLEQRNAYPLAVLRLALDKAGSDLAPEPSPHSMAQSRALWELEQGREIDLLWSMTSRERERRLRPIRIPLDKGLYGWRVALVKRQARNPLAGIERPAQLARLRAGQGHDWPDSRILAHNQLPVVTSASYPSLFRMLEAGRFEYFPRSLLEIREEAERPENAGLMVDSHLLLHYPTALYFFVGKHDEALARQLETGLEAALADGSFEALFQRHFASSLARLQVHRRLLIELRNPLLPAETPLARRALWLDREQLSRFSSGHSTAR